MVAALDARTVDYRTERRVVVQHLALQDAAIFEREVEHVAVRRVWHRIKPYDRHRILEMLQDVTDTSQIAMPTMQTPYSAKRLSLRQWLHTRHTPMQRMHLASFAALVVGLDTVVSGQTFRTDVQQVAVPVTVQSQSGERAASLTAEDFKVFDNGHLRPIVAFGKFQQPLHVLLLLDTSRSVLNSLLEVTSAARAVIAQLAPDDSIHVGTFSDALRLSPPLSAADVDLV